MRYNPLKPGDLFELLDSGEVQCKACAEIVARGGDSDEQAQLLIQHHAEKRQVVNGKPGSCAQFWEGSR